MRITVGTFNLKNLFSRYNFQAEIQAIRADDTTVEDEVLYEFGDDNTYKIRTFKGRLVNAKKLHETARIAQRIINMDVDVLAVQEVENIDILKQFNRENLDSMYPHVALIEGNDPRLIDVGYLSKYPMGAVTSWQKKRHPENPVRPVFGRDLLEVEILNSTRTKKLFTIFNTHLKSHFVDYREDQALGEQRNTERRTRQAEMITEIIKERTRPNSRYILTGDMNDPPDSQALQPFVSDNELDLTDALINPIETRLPKQDNPMPPSSAWTHRHKASGHPAQYHLYDQIWISSSLANKQTGAWIDRRTRHSGDGSDHDPAWIELDL